jgi:hypothetical protein
MKPRKSKVSPIAWLIGGLMALVAGSGVTIWQITSNGQRLNKPFSIDDGIALLIVVLWIGGAFAASNYAFPNRKQD